MRPAALLGVLLLRVFGCGQEVAAFEQKNQDAKSEDFLFEIQPRVITPGTTAVLRWSIKGATKVVIEEAIESGTGPGALHTLGTFEGNSGTLEVKPTDNTTYVISCTGSTTYSCASLSVRVRVKQR
jgi:hypothetical protein